MLLFFELGFVFCFCHPGDSNVESEFKTMTMVCGKEGKGYHLQRLQNLPKIIHVSCDTYHRDVNPGLQTQCSRKKI